MIFLVKPLVIKIAGIRVIIQKGNVITTKIVPIIKKII